MASELEVTTIRGLSSGANANQILVPSGQTLHAPGHIIQVQSAAKRDTFTHATSTFTDIGLTITITPEQSNSHIMIVASVAGASQTSSATTLRLLRDGTVILPDNPTSPGNRQVGMYDMYTAGNQYNLNSYSFTFVDTGRTAGTSAITYKFQLKTHNTGAVYINRSSNDSNVSNYVRSTSHIQLLEIAQ
tara:strand:+ start:1416 stop:1982 length:567 start_codon:yes stop_codon:yes gene_type:complete